MEAVKRPARGTEVELRDAAMAAGKRAGCFYSHFPVGAAIRLKDGSIVSGFNWESPSYPCTICAERMTIFTAIDTRDIKPGDVECIAIWGNTDGPISPCGMCRQVMMDALGPKTEVLLLDRDGLVYQTSVKDLLPGGFTKEDLV